MYGGLLLFACVLKPVLMLQMEDFLYKRTFGTDGVDETEDQHQMQVDDSVVFGCISVIATIFIQQYLPCKARSKSRCISRLAAQARSWKTLMMMEMLQLTGCLE